MLRGAGILSSEPSPCFCGGRADCIDGKPWLPKTLSHNVIIGLDRGSFYDRGWTREEIGMYNGGAATEKRGIFLSMFYALEMGWNKSHPWHEASHKWDRGLGAHIDQWLFARHKKHFRLYVYDDEGSGPPKSGMVRGRNGNEYPFNSPEFAHALGVAGGDTTIYIRADYPAWGLGLRMDAPASQLTDGRVFVNISYVIAHEAGHYFGLPHLSNRESIMHCQVGGVGTYPKWQTPKFKSNRLFERLVDNLPGGVRGRL